VRKLVVLNYKYSFKSTVAKDFSFELVKKKPQWLLINPHDVAEEMVVFSHVFPPRSFHCRAFSGIHLANNTLSTGTPM
jgi:hypothetical protein